MSKHSEDHSNDETLARCEDVLGYRFHNRELLELALTHASIAKTRVASNERMEFLGDAILGAIVCEMLYHRFPKESEGELTRIKSVLVSRITCAKISEDLKLDQFLLLGKGLTTHQAIPQSIVAAVFESIIAGIYLDGGLEETRQFIERVMTEELEEAAEASHGQNYKSLLQQFSQKASGETPFYRLLDEKGPDHSKCFKIAVSIGEQSFPAAWGPNKKEAEQRAANNALCEIEGKELQCEAE